MTFVDLLHVLLLLGAAAGMIAGLRGCSRSAASSPSSCASCSTSAAASSA